MKKETGVFSVSYAENEFPQKGDFHNQLKNKRPDPDRKKEETDPYSNDEFARLYAV